MSTALLSSEQRPLANFSDVPPDGLLPTSPDIETKLIGITKDGVLYFYGDTAATPGPVVPAVCGLILDIQLSTHGLESKYMPRDYLDLRLQTPTPLLQYILRLPAKSYAHPVTGIIQHPWSVRSLLGALTTLDLQGVAVKIEAKRGRDATFIQVSLDPAGKHRVTEPAIGPSRQDLENAIDLCRRSLGLEPQFT